MAETAALLADEILPERPLRQWVLSLPMALRFLLATRPAVLSAVLGVVYRTISGHLLSEAGLTRLHRDARPWGRLRAQVHRRQRQHLHRPRWADNIAV